MKHKHQYKKNNKIDKIATIIFYSLLSIGIIYILKIRKVEKDEIY